MPEEMSTPTQHLRLLGRLVYPLMLIIDQGLDRFSEMELAEISGLHRDTCRRYLRELEKLGYVRRNSRRYYSYSLLPLAFKAIPQVRIYSAPERGDAAQERGNTVQAESAIPDDEPVTR